MTSACRCRIDVTPQPLVLRADLVLQVLQAVALLLQSLASRSPLLHELRSTCPSSRSSSRSGGCIDLRPRLVDRAPS
eukprot:8016816-Heterocapsa_arctica.AAC.1